MHFKREARAGTPLLPPPNSLQKMNRPKISNFYYLLKTYFININNTDQDNQVKISLFHPSKRLNKIDDSTYTIFINALSACGKCQ